MAAPRSKNKQQAAALRAECWRLHVRGWSTERITEQLGITPPAVHHHLKRARAETSIESTERLAERLAELDAIRREMWGAWETSPKSRGDTAYLTQIQDAIKQERGLLGLDAPQRTEHSGPDGTPIHITTDAQRTAQDELTEWRQQMQQQLNSLNAAPTPPTPVTPSE